MEILLGMVIGAAAVAAAERGRVALQRSKGVMYALRAIRDRQLSRLEASAVETADVPVTRS